MKFIQKLAAFLTMAVICTGIAGIAAAQDATSGATKTDPKQTEVKNKYAKYPELSKEQQDKIDKLRLDFAKELLGLKNQIEEKRAHLKTISMVDQPDMTAVNKTIDEMYALKADLSKKKAAHIQEVRKVLTPEQRLHFDMQQAKKFKGKGRHGEMGPDGPPMGKACKQGGPGCMKGDDDHMQGPGGFHGKDCPNKQNAPDMDDKK